MKKADVYYEAMLARDHRFDGKFFVGVKTTGIYCRPICPAKPKRENVEFFSNALAAEKAGYRPCMRCHPESAPMSPVWLGKSAMVTRAIRMINNRETLSFDEDRFAEMFGVSARHLRRVFIEEIGKTPKQLAFENRLNLARKLIAETNLSVTEIAFASGFESIRRFNDAYKERFKKSPTETRRKKVVKEEGLKVTLSYRPPYDFEGLLQFYRNHQMGNLERFEKGKMIRVISYDGKIGEVAISNDEKNSELVVEIDFPDTSYIQVILTKVKNLFDIDSDPVIIGNVLETNPKIKKLWKKYPGTRLPSGWDGFEVGVSAILGQLVSIERGRALVDDLIELLGEKREYNGKTIKLFPTPQKIARSSLEGLKTTTMRKTTLKEFAKRVAEKKLSLDSAQDSAEFYSAVQTIKGIGPWTASYMGLKVIRHTDAIPLTDLIIARALEKYPEEIIEKMAPWRGYVAALLWREYALALKKTRKK